MKRIVTLDEKMDNALVSYARERNMTIATVIRLSLKKLIEEDTGVELEARLKWGGSRKDSKRGQE